MAHSPVMVVLPDDKDQAFANQLAAQLGYPSADIVIGSPLDAVTSLVARPNSPRYLVIDIGVRAADVLAELDAVAEHCESTTRVVIIGEVNDVNFYRALRGRGIIEYFTRPAKLQDLRTALIAEGQDTGDSGSTVIAFMSAASGDGASTIALNTSYALAAEYRKPVVLIDMDFQFGMIAKNLDLSTSFGIKELFEHPDRGIDSVLVQRMMIPYGDRLKIIAAPNDLYPLPDVPPEVVGQLIQILRRDFAYIVFDLPHVWTPWTAAALSHSNRAVMVAQLWLRSVTHASRLLGAWQATGLEKEQTSILINRSGAKFKEAISTRDFERVCGRPLQYYFLNDIKSVVAAENQGKTIMEVGNSVLGRQFREFARMLGGGTDAITAGTHAQKQV